MPKAWLVFCLSGCLSSVHAEDATFAWHFAVPPVAELSAPRDPDGEPGDPFSPAPPTVAPEAEPPAAKEIPEPPAATVFATKGERLLDLGPVFQRVSKMPAGSWMIWNETRHLLVAQGDLAWLASVEQLSGFANQPKVAALSFEWFRGNDPAGKPVQRVEFRGRSGMRLAGKWKAADAPPAPAITAVEFSGEPTFADSPEAIDLSFKLGWTERSQDGDLSWTLESGASMGDLLSNPLLLLEMASPSGETWRISGAAQRVLADGILSRESRWVERAGKAEALVPGLDDEYLAPPLEVEIAGTKLTRKTYLVPVDAIRELLAAHPAPEDPSAASLSGLKEIEVPVSLWAGIGGKLLDVKPLLRNCGIVLGDRNWACYDPTHRLLHVAVVETMPVNPLDQIDMLVEPSCVLLAKNLRVRLRAEQPGSTPPVVRDMSITGRSGRRWVVGCSGQTAELLHWIVEPVIGDSNSIVDIHQECLLPAAVAGAVVESSGDVTLAMVRDLEWQVSEAGGKRTSLLLRVEAVEGKPTRETAK